MNAKIKTEIAIGIILLVAIIIGGLFWLNGKKEQAQVSAPVSIAKPSLTPAVQPVAPPAQTSQDTSGWQTYRNEKYGFEFQYPQNLIITAASSDSDIIISDDKEGHWIYEIKLLANSNNLSLQQAFGQAIKEFTNSLDNSVKQTINITNVNVSGILAKRYSIENYTDYGNAGVVLLNRKNIITIFGDDSETTLKSGFETILYTFKFTN